RARTEGFTIVASAGGNVGDLARLAGAQLRAQDGRLLHVTGSVVAGDLVGLLRAQGFMVERSVLYETRPTSALSAATVRALRAGAIGFALFFSPRTAAVFARLADAARVAESCGTVIALSISAATDAALADLPWHDRRIAERPDQQALLGGLDRLLDERRQR